MSVQTSLNSIKTNIQAENYGKRTKRNPNHFKADFMLQVHKAGKKCQRIFATLANNGTISFYQASLVYLMNNRSTSNLMAQGLFITTALDPNEYTSNNRIMYNDSNPHLMKLYNMDNSSYNSAIINGNLGSAYIPYTLDPKSDLKWDPNYNQHTLVLAHKLNKILEQNITESDKNKAMNAAWDEYKKFEEQLIEKGILISNNVVVVKENGFVPAVTVHQNSESSNGFFNSETLFSHKKSKATYAPSINSVSGIFSITGTKKDPLSEWTYGITELNTNNSDDSKRTIKGTSVEVKGYNFLNSTAENPLRIVVRDDVRNTRNNSSRAENFLDFIENNQYVQVQNAELRLGVTSLGGFSSTFSLEGNSLNYTSYTSNVSTTADTTIKDDLNSTISLDNIDDSYVFGTSNELDLEHLARLETKSLGNLRETDDSDDPFTEESDDFASKFANF